MVGSPSLVPDDGAQTPVQDTALSTQDPFGHNVPIKGASAMLRPGGKRSDQGHHQDRSGNRGTSSSAPTFKEEQNVDEGGEGDESRIVSGGDEMLGNEESKEVEERVQVEQEEREKGGGRGESSSYLTHSWRPSNPSTTQPDPLTGRERRASDVVRVFWDLIDGEFVQIPPDSSDRLGAWTGEKQREMDEGLRKLYEERRWSVRG